MRSKIAEVIRYSLMPSMLFCLTSCGVSQTEISQHPSPDGQYIATLEVRDCGAACSPSAKVTLHDPHDRIGKGDIEVFDGRGGWPVELHWIGPRAMVVTFCEGRRFEVRSDIQERREDPAEPGVVTVIVVNDEQMVVGGKAYCRFPEPAPVPSSSTPKS